MTHTHFRLQTWVAFNVNHQNQNLETQTSRNIQTPTSLDSGSVSLPQTESRGQNEILPHNPDFGANYYPTARTNFSRQKLLNGKIHAC